MDPLCAEDLPEARDDGIGWIHWLQSAPCISRERRADECICTWNAHKIVRRDGLRHIGQRTGYKAGMVGGTDVVEGKGSAAVFHRERGSLNTGER